MTPGRHLICGAVITALQAGSALGQDLSVWAGETRLAAHPLPACLVWNHSVSGGLVADCFDHAPGQLVLTRSYLHDFAAGLGEVAGRGQLRPAPQGGYWIEGINEPLPDGLQLRLGGEQVAHRLVPAPVEMNLPDSLGPPQPLPNTLGRVILRLEPKIDP